MKIIGTLISLVALSHAALIPIDSSVVDVKSQHSGQDYSYSIHENRGFVIDPTITTVQHQILGVKAAPGEAPVTKTTQEHFKDHKEGGSETKTDSAEKPGSPMAYHVPYVIPNHVPFIPYPYYPVYPARTWPFAIV